MFKILLLICTHINKFRGTGGTAELLGQGNAIMKGKLEEK
jgi:hypothetical protein